MAFDSFVFLWIFLPLALAGAFLFRKKGGNLFLLAAGLLFYAWGEPKYILLLLVSVFVNYLGGILIDRAERKKRLTAAAVIVLDVVLLGYFKYFNFFAGILDRSFRSELIPLRSIALPLGISFFTFQEISYIMDVLRGNIPSEKSVVKFALYVCFFPTIVSGPIVRYKDVAAALSGRSLSTDRAADGLSRFCFGLAKKVLIANTLGNTVDAVISAGFSRLSPLIGWVSAVFYTLQIYFDFSGYSDMALGLAFALGFDIPENFDDPYLAGSVQDFWRRWHISLSGWFRDYLYIPLGGNRQGQLRTLLNTAVVFAVTGLWHGASWNFVVWGLYHGLFLILERLGFGRKLPPLLRRIGTFVIVCIGWVFFRADSLAAAVEQLRLMFGLLPARCVWNLSEFVSPGGWLVFGAAVLLSGELHGKLKRFLRAHDSLRFGAALLLFLVSLVFLANAAHHPFIYFRF